MPTQRADDIHAMIMATAHDGAAGTGSDASYVADIDLSGLAVALPEFLHATGLLRREFGHRTDSQFQLGLRQFFTKLLSRPGIYLTEYFRTCCEEQARRNIEALIAGEPG